MEKEKIHVEKVHKRVKMDTWRAVKYQLLTCCYLRNIISSDAELECLTFLAISGDQELTDFCNKSYEKKIFKSSQSARNALTKLEKKSLIVKQGKNKKKIGINPALQISTKGNLLLNFEFLALASH